MMKYDIIAKNLLLNRDCWDCDFAATLATRGFDLRLFSQNIGFSADDIHEKAYKYDTLFMCHHHNKILPKELSCSDWVKARE